VRDKGIELSVKVSHPWGEILIADNGSTDGFPRDCATSWRGASFSISDRGYGAALIGGIEAAKGRFVIMGDAGRFVRLLHSSTRSWSSYAKDTILSLGTGSKVE